jgi:plasmid stabilization system protein ParE
VSFQVRLRPEAEEDLLQLYDLVLERELVIPFGHAGYVALFEVVDPTLVVVAAVRHQREDDYN